MIYCVWYPSGGFGHFLNAILTLYGQGFERPELPKKQFGKNGNSHSLKLVAPKFLHDPETYNHSFNDSNNYSVLIDNGINNESTRFRNFFPESIVIKICYDDYTWPVVARTMIEKAMEVDFATEISVDSNWQELGVWALREKYFLFLRDHEFRHKWRPDPNCRNLQIDKFLSYPDIRNFLDSCGIVLEDFLSFWQNYKQLNKIYFDPGIVAKEILQDVKNKNWRNITVDDVWTQAMVYYYIWLEYNFEVPHNDYSEWFTNTKEISIMLDKHGVNS